MLHYIIKKKHLKIKQNHTTINICLKKNMFGNIHEITQKQITSTYISFISTIISLMAFFTGSRYHNTWLDNYTNTTKSASKTYDTHKQKLTHTILFQILYFCAYNDLKYNTFNFFAIGKKYRDK